MNTLIGCKILLTQSKISGFRLQHFNLFVLTFLKEIGMWLLQSILWSRSCMSCRTDIHYDAETDLKKEVEIGLEELRKS